MKRLWQRLWETQDEQAVLSRHDTTRWLVIDGAASIPMMMLHSGPLLVAYLVALGADAFQIGMVAAIFHASNLMQLVGLRLFRRVRRRRALTVLASGSSRLLWVLILLVPAVPSLRGPGGVGGVLVLFLGASFLWMLPVPAWNSWYKELVPSRRLGQISGVRMMLGIGLALVLTLGAGQTIRIWKEAAPETYLYAYSASFLAFVIAALIGIAAVYRLPESRLKHLPHRSLATLLAEPIRDRNFLRLIGFISVWNFAVFMASAFFTYTLLKRVGLSEAEATGLWALQQVAAVATFRLWGRVADHHSSKTVFARSGPILMVSLLLWPVAIGIPDPMGQWGLLIGIHLLTGIALAGAQLGSITLAYKLAPRQSADNYLTVFGLTGVISGGISPLLVGFLFKNPAMLPQIGWIFPVAALLGFAALGLLRGVNEASNQAA